MLPNLHRRWQEKQFKMLALQNLASDRAARFIDRVHPGLLADKLQAFLEGKVVSTPNFLARIEGTKKANISLACGISNRANSSRIPNAAAAQATAHRLDRRIMKMRLQLLL